MKAYDAIVVGAGVNGLTCAAYLARSGLRVLVLEARERIGGMAELALSVDGLSRTVVRDLGLRGHGLRFGVSDVSVFAPQRDGGAITLWHDVARTAQALADNPLAGRRDADAYAAADQRVRASARALARLLGAPPRGGNPLVALSVVPELPMNLRDLVVEWFDSDALRAAVAARGVLYTGLGPRAPGTAAVLLTQAAHNGAGLAGATVVARGGPRAVIDALAASLGENGGEIRTAARVARVRRHGDRTAGIVLDSGEEIDARLVVSSLDPQTTLLDLLEPEVLGPRLSWRAANIRQTGFTAWLRFRLGAPPRFTAAADDAGELLRGRILIGPSMRYLDRAARPARYGASADEPLLEMILSGKELTVAAQAVAGDAAADEVAEAATRTIEAYAPGFADLVEQRTVLTPRDIEREYGARGGHPMHAEVALDQWFEWRPLHGLGQYRMPLGGFYLCGAGSHPGGGVTAAVGRLAARQILADAKQGRLRLSA